MVTDKLLASVHWSASLSSVAISCRKEPVGLSHSVVVLGR